MSINNVTISGNLTREPELRTTAGGMAILSLGVAVNERRKNANGEYEDYANFIDCTMFGKRAENMSKFLTKGTKVAINGKLRYNQWEKDGVKHSKLSVIVNDIEFMSKKQNEGNANANAQPALYDEDIPF